MSQTSPLAITFHGAAQTVTGSCMELALAGHGRILVDCGLFQGSRTLETLNHGAFGFDPREIAAVVLTHAHIDHCGLLPRLMREGWHGPIFCTRATADLLEYMLADAGRIQEGDAMRRNRRPDRRGEAHFEPLYTEKDGLAAWRATKPVALHEWFEPAPGFRARLWPAGHILGSASAEIEAGGVRLLCSGDLGPANKELEPDAEAPTGLDHVICESTYGNRAREHVTITQRRDLLEAEVKQALARGGNLVIPVFALERTQELLTDLIHLAEANRIPGVPIFVDSPLASRASRVFAAHADELEDLGGIDITRHPSVHYVEDPADSMHLNTVSGAIILSASGMCEAGRIRHHLKHNLCRRESTVLFVGFQAAGSLGRVILEGAPRVRISGDEVAVHAHIRRIDSYSAHADQSELAAWIAARGAIAGSLILSHGEPDAIAALAHLVQGGDPALKIVRPAIGESFALPKGAPAHRLTTGRTDIQQALGHDWQNDYASFAASLKDELDRIKGGAERQRVIAEMRRVLAAARG